MEESGTGYNVWVRRLDREPSSKLTLEGTFNAKPTWLPDGRSVMFASNRGGNRDLWVKRADGSGVAEVLRDVERSIWSGRWSRDGKWLVYVTTPPPSRDIFAVRPRVDSAPVAIVETEFEEFRPTLSPDGRWLAYQANKSGRYEVYVQGFPNAAGGVWQVSTSGGVDPVWAHSGRELFYRRNSRIMVVDVVSATTFVAREQRALFDIPGVWYPFAIAPHDNEFLMIRARGLGEAGELIVVENFFEELKAKVAK